MNATRSVREGGRIRTVLCLVLIAALLCGLFALNSFAAGEAPAVETGKKVVSCSTHTAMVSEGDLYVWGTNDQGQFPNTEETYAVDPVFVAKDVADVAVSNNRTLVVYENGDLYLYGCDPLTGEAGLAEKLASDAAQVACGPDFAMYVTKKGELRTWGVNECGQLGNGTYHNVEAPTRILNSIVRISAGRNFGLALTESGNLYGWGADAFQQFGWTEKNGSSPETVPSPVKVMENVRDMDAGSDFSCIITKGGDLYTCGQNLFNQTGSDSLDGVVPFTKILSNVVSVSAGSTHGFAITGDGDVYSWGYGLSGQQGNGDTGRVIGAARTSLTYSQIFAGDETSFGIDCDGNLWSWGANTNRLLCTMSGSDTATPVRVLNSDMSWAFSWEELSDEPEHDAAPSGGGSDHPDTGSAEQPAPIVVTTPFISGDGNGTFRPDDHVKRSEFLRMVVTALTDFDADTDYGDCTFTDVSKDDWFAPYVTYAAQAGLISGYEDGTCRPTADITRAEAAKITATALKLTSNVTVSSFTDVTKAWSIPAIEALSEAGIISGDGDGTFRPNDLLSRAEAAKIVGAYGFKPDSTQLNSMRETVESPFTDVSPAKWYYPYVLFAAGLLEPAE